MAGVCIAARTATASVDVVQWPVVGAAALDRVDIVGRVSFPTTMGFTAIPKACGVTAAPILYGWVDRAGTAARV